MAALSLALGLWLLAGVEAPEPAVTRSVDYYEVGGTTESTIRAELDRLGPKNGAGLRFDALGRWEVGWEHESEFDYEKAECRLKTLRTTVTLHVLLPRWKNRATSSPALGAKWERYVKALEEHEKGHSAVGLEAGAAVRQRLLDANTATTCRRLEMAIDEAGNEVVAEHSKRDASYDLRTVHGLTQGAVFP